MARQGRAGAAIAIAALASLMAGLFGLAGLALLLGSAGAAAVLIGPQEHFALVALGLALVVLLVGTSALRGAVAALIGFLLSFVGTDIISGSARMTFGRPELLDGIGIVPLAVGLFAVGEVLTNLARADRPARPSPPRHLTDLVPTQDDLRTAAPAAVQGSIVGFIVGIVPGAGATVAAFLSYALAKRGSPHRERFGRGAVEGVAAPEAANNAEPMGAMVPFLALGIPGSGTTAVLLAALPAWGINAGPLLVRERSDLVWAFVAAMALGNLLLLLVNLPLAPLFASVLRLPERLLTATVLTVSVVGVYVVDRDPFDVVLVAVFGVAGFALRRADVPLAALVLAFVLGSVAERGLRASLIMSAGDPLAFLGRPLTAVLLVTAAAVLAAPLVRRARRGIA
jgi:putative tricarboxylic transport membrane protein